MSRVNDWKYTCQLESDILRQKERITELESALVKMEQRAEAAEAIIKASGEQEPIGEIGFNKLGAKYYLYPPIPPDVAELQRQLEEAIRKLEAFEHPSTVTCVRCSGDGWFFDEHGQCKCGLCDGSGQVLSAAPTDQPKEQICAI